MGRKGEHVVRIGPNAWDDVLQAIPSPVGYWKLRDVWKKACRAVGQRDDHLYDLRHCHGQWATDAGVPEARVGQSLRHKTAAMTRRYTRSQDKGEVADALDTVMFPTVEGAQEASI